ncbi:MAG: hypothetical protein EOO88_25310 [Pedobacter sp.]|nr:MAG: hypothetical protein EOO88_25310 [Pedobacter sp.]
MIISFKIRRLLAVSSLALFTLFCGCVERIYKQNDFRLYSKNFRLPDGALLRTDGVYVLDSIYAGGAKRKATEHRFYTFFEGGQVNLTLDMDHLIHTNKDYEESVKRHLQSWQVSPQKTLFEGYFYTEGNRIVIERASVPRNLLVYTYGKLAEDRLEVVKQAINGRGRIQDKYFESDYRETYRFLPLSKTAFTSVRPGW